MVNDTIILGNFTVIPGIRFDNTNMNGILPAEPRITWKACPKLCCAPTAARGFTIDPRGHRRRRRSFSSKSEFEMETVESFQAGFESTALKYLWTKMTLFRDNIENALDYSTSQTLNLGRERRTVLKLCSRQRLPWFALSAGAEFITTKDLNADQIVRVPTQVYDIGLVYNDGDSWHGLLQGRHINWNAWDSYESKYHSFLVDMNVSKKLFQRKDVSLEASQQS